MADQLHLITGRNVEYLSLENVYIILCSTKISGMLYQKGWQFSSHLITGRNVKYLSLENVTLYCFSTKISVRLYHKGATQLPPNNM